MQMKSNRKVSELASAYKQYASLKQDIGRIDSLLKLGSLSREALNRKLRMIRKHQQEALQRSREAIQEQNNLSNTRAEDIYKDSVTAGSASQQYGFLNYKNSQRVQRAKQQFIAVWGRRALADNWRRREVYSGASNTGKPQNIDSVANKKAPVQDEKQRIDLSAIPRTPEARNKLRKQQWHDQYMLGSLFFLTFNQPDSSAYYYHSILHRPISDSLKARTLYSLYELYKLNSQPDSAAIYKKQILEHLPHSKFADRLQKNEKGTSGGASTQQQDSTAEIRQKAHRLMQHHADSSRQKVAEKLRHLALNHRHSPAAPSIYYEGIRRYIQYAKARDSVQTTSDSLNTQLYSGKDWDRVREMLAEFKETFPNASQVSQVDTWLSMLKGLPQVDSIRTCKELGVKPEIAGGMEHFVQSIELPHKAKQMHISGSLRFRIVIGKEGEVKSSKLLSEPTNLGIEQAYEQAINDSLQFEPVKREGRPVRVSCEVEFPVKE
jgi:hypothetical protein